MQLNEVTFAEILNSKDLTYRLIRRFGGLSEVLSASSGALHSIIGISDRQVHIIRALGSICDKNNAPLKGLPVVRTPERAVTLLAPHYIGRKNSRFSVLLINVEKQCVGIHLLPEDIHPGHVNWAQIVLRHAVRANAKHIVIATNSAEPTITAQEHQHCRRLYATSSILGIELIDYIKFGRVGWHSLARADVPLSQTLG